VRSTATVAGGALGSAWFLARHTGLASSAVLEILTNRAAWEWAGSASRCHSVARRRGGAPRRPCRTADVNAPPILDVIRAWSPSTASIYLNQRIRPAPAHFRSGR
jgi:hypothetical protein